ncbi:MAG: hypothetical protein HY270_06050 [Deltaproteobacteria bacterium]|nr:hypothetical protein [Deltaproteobacteria bacterium]
MTRSPAVRLPNPGGVPASTANPTPSREDIEITRRLREVSDLFGIRFLDHIIIGRERYVSFVDDGYW